MRLYVVNCTGQHRQVNYRLDYTVDDQGRHISDRFVPYKSITVPARQQVQFGGELLPMQFDDLVQQLERTCGAVNVSAVRTAKAHGPVKMIWSQDKPVPQAILKDVVDHNMMSLSEMGAKRRAQLALVADVTLSQAIEKPAPKIELEFESADQDENFESLEEGLRITRPNPQPPTPTPKRRASRKAA